MITHKKTNRNKYKSFSFRISLWINCLWIISLKNSQQYQTVVTDSVTRGQHITSHKQSPTTVIKDLQVQGLH